MGTKDFWVVADAHLIGRYYYYHDDYIQPLEKHRVLC